MLGEDQIFKAKAFLRVYKDAISCIQQIAEKNECEQANKNFYEKLKLSIDEREVSVNAEGNLEKAGKYGWFTKMNLLSQ